MAITVPSDGDDIETSWAQSVANQLNAAPITTFMLTAAESTNSASPSDITGAGFAVVNGREYVVYVRGLYSVSATNQGPGVGLRHPGGSAKSIWRIFGPSSASAEVIERLLQNSAATDSMTTQATTNASGTIYAIEGSIHYSCTASGTLQFRKVRNGTSGSTGVTLEKPWSFICHASAI